MYKRMKRAAAAFMALACLLALTGCSSLGGSSETESIRLMVWSPSEDQSQDSGQWLQTCCENFAALHPEWDITFVYGVADEATAADTVAQDPEDSADVFMYANDTITTLTDAGALAKFGGVYEEEMRQQQRYAAGLPDPGRLPLRRTLHHQHMVPVLRQERVL